MEYLKLFENHSLYADFIKTEDFVRPNVSHCVSENEVHYNSKYIKFKDPDIEQLLIDYMNDLGLLESTNGITYEEAASLTTFGSLFNYLSYGKNGQFVKYYDFDEFLYFTGITEIGYTTGYTSYSMDGTFYGCIFKNITIPASITKFGTYSFANHGDSPDFDDVNLFVTGSTIKFLSSTPPQLVGSNTQYRLPANFETILVPSGSASNYLSTFGEVNGDIIEY